MRRRPLTIVRSCDYQLREEDNFPCQGQPRDSRFLAAGLTFWRLLGATEAAPVAFASQSFFAVVLMEFADLFLSFVVVVVGRAAEVAVATVAAVAAVTGSAASVAAVVAASPTR